MGERGLASEIQRLTTLPCLGHRKNTGLLDKRNCPCVNILLPAARAYVSLAMGFKTKINENPERYRRSIVPQISGEAKQPPINKTCHLHGSADNEGRVAVRLLSATRKHRERALARCMVVVGGKTGLRTRRVLSGRTSNAALC